MNVVILAAGMGKRMRSQYPKVLHQVAGKSMVEWVLDATAKFAESQVIVVGHKADLVKEALSSRPHLKFAIQKELKGTGDAVRCALDFLDLSQAYTLVCLGDVPLLSTTTIERLYQACQGHTPTFGLITVTMPNPFGYGRIVRDSLGQVSRIVEEKDATQSEKQITEVNTGIMLLPTQMLPQWLSRLTNQNAQQEYYLTDCIQLAVQDHIPIATVFPAALEEVQGVNSPQELAKVERFWQQQQAQKLLENGVTLMDPNRIDVRGTLICGQDVQIDVGCIFEGHVVLEDGVKVGAYCVIKDSEIARNTTILPFCHIEQAKVGMQSKVGPYSRLRPGSVLSGDNHIGNFVEIKKSTIGQATKVNHLTYLGDSEVGQRVNIGAGTITCNYDGVNKFKTIIGDDAFIGSDTQLVAPVVVGAGATLGAGTTLTKNAPEGKLTLSRVRQTTVDHWKRPTKKVD